MRHLKKIGVFLIIFTFVFQAVGVPISAMSNEDQVKLDDLQTTTILVAESGENVPLYEEESEDSEIIAVLQSDDEVVILERLDDFSLVEFIKDDNKEVILQGFILNDDLDFSEEKFLDDMQIATIQSDDEIDVPLYEENSEDSEILTLLQPNDEVVVLEKAVDFSFVEYVGNDEEVWQGFIHNHFLGFHSDNIYEELPVEPNEEATNGEPSHELGEPSNYDDTNDNDQNTAETNEADSNNDELEPIEENPDTNDSMIIEDDSNNGKLEPIEENPDTNDSVIIEDDSNTANQMVNPSSVKMNLMMEATSSRTSLEGIALKKQTSVYAETSSSSKSLKTYPAGTILKYSEDPKVKDWYTTGGYIKGVKHAGFIHKSHVENILRDQVLLEGIALKNPTSVYMKASTGSEVQKSYPVGSVLKYYTYSENWYKTGVYINGKKRTGYIHKTHVENTTKNQVLLEGIALKDSTSVYTRASTSSETKKSYPAGSILKYYTYSNDWYKTGVYVNGKKQTGYIHKSHVENATTNPKLHEGISKNSTAVYVNASTKSGALKVYPAGSILKYYTYSKDWYRTGVYINGKKQTGYIHKSHVENATEDPRFHEGVALKNPTKVYTNASTHSTVLRSYGVGSIMKFYTYSKDWYRTGVYIDGKKQTGYIHKSHVGDGNTRYDLTLEQALDIQMKATPQTDNKYAWVSKEYIDKNNKVTVSSLNVRPRPGTESDESFDPIGTLSKGTTVKILEEYNGWYAIEYNSKDQWRHARPSDVMYYLNPLNFINDSIQQFQFLNLARTSGASKTVMNNYLRGKGILNGQAEAFIEAGQQYGINDIYLISHALLETANGTSTLANGVKYNGKTVYNMYGIGAYDSCPIECGAKRAFEEGWTTPAKAIIGGAEFIGNDYIKSGQNTLYKMRWNPAAMASTNKYGKQYATDIGWASKQISTMYNLYQEIGEYTLYLDIPIYK